MADRAPLDRRAVTDQGEHPQRLDGMTRALLLAFGALTLLAVVTMYVLAEDTSRSFAWTIEPPLTATFLGAGYGAGLAAVIVSLRRDEWAPVRIGLQAIFVFVAVTTAATVLHLDRFHFDAEGLAQLAAWTWLIVYVVVPVWMAAVLLRTRGRRQRAGPPALPAPAIVLLSLKGLLFGGVGVALFAVPRSEQLLWPWELSPLTARALAAWLLALAVAALLAIRERDVTALQVPAAIYLAVALLYAGGLVRFPGQVAWELPAAWLLALLVVVMAASGAAGTVYASRAPGRS